MYVRPEATVQEWRPATGGRRPSRVPQSTAVTKKPLPTSLLGLFYVRLLNLMIAEHKGELLTLKFNKIIYSAFRKIKQTFI